VHVAASSRIRFLYFALKRRRDVFAVTSVGGLIAPLSTLVIKSTTLALLGLYTKLPGVTVSTTLAQRVTPTAVNVPTHMHDVP